MKFGKCPARRGAVKFALSDYVDTSKLPPVPANFGHDGLISDYHVLGNDVWSNCVWAGAAHETVLWNRQAGNTVHITTADTLSDYAAVTGFNPNDPSSDQGTDMVQAADYRRKVGIRDAQNNRHTVAAYLSLKPGSLSDVWAATYLFGAVGIGLEMPSTAERQFDDGQPWDVVPGSSNVGGHYVTMCGRQDDFLHVVTWGKVQRMTLAFYQAYCDEVVCYLSAEALSGDKSLEGFDQAALTADLASLSAA